MLLLYNLKINLEIKFKPDLAILLLPFLFGVTELVIWSNNTREMKRIALALLFKTLRKNLKSKLLLKKKMVPSSTLVTRKVKAVQLSNTTDLLLLSASITPSTLKDL